MWKEGGNVPLVDDEALSPSERALLQVLRTEMCAQDELVHEVRPVQAERERQLHGKP